MIEDMRSGFVAIIGAPNAGKSTLVNQLIGSKITIVTHKVQTTRSIVRGICIQDNSQIIFVDTPGIFAPKRRLDRSMVDAAWRGAGDADVVVLMHDAQKGEIDTDTQRILEELKGIRKKIVLVLNKIDLIATQNLLPLAAAFEKACVFDATFMISAANGMVRISSSGGSLRGLALSRR